MLADRLARPERKTVTPTEQGPCFLSRTHPEQTLAVEHSHKVYDSVLKNLGDGLHRHDALGRGAMTDKCAKIDRFGSYRRTKIEGRGGRLLFCVARADARS